MKARFIGDPNDDFSGPDTLDLFGVSFRKGVWADVPPAVGRAAQTHSHFEVKADRPRKEQA